MRPIITAYDWVPDFAKGQVRDLRVRWALEQVGQAYDVLYLQQGEQKQPLHRDRQPFGQGAHVRGGRPDDGGGIAHARRHAAARRASDTDRVCLASRN
ncbi:hypothetical protein [Sphingomonas sp. PP-CE-3A-406]|uniref:hypothetical protein n=1 Tax=Sphingomonas sp. PP-CE-3A-406 TaxID=2135659 RepID=UPI00217CF461|nr:hypothetical protein [Sphingomonas sp. PP-CE-3A-406]